MKKYYVYALLDPRKKGDYNYGNLNFEYEPFYVGKGCGKRMSKHSFEDKSNPFRSNKIKKILKEGKKYLSIQIFKNLTEKNAFKKEKEIIKLIGRKNGPLTNLTDGGEGIILSKEQLINRGKNISKTLKNKKIDHYWSRGENNYKIKNLNITDEIKNTIIKFYVINKLSLRKIKEKLFNDYNFKIGTCALNSFLRRKNIKLRDNTLESSGKRTEEHIKKLTDSRKWYYEKTINDAKWFLKNKKLLNDVKKLLNEEKSIHKVVSILKDRYEKIFLKKGIKFDYNRIYKIKIFLKNGR